MYSALSPLRASLCLPNQSECCAVEEVVVALLWRRKLLVSQSDVNVSPRVTELHTHSFWSQPRALLETNEDNQNYVQGRGLCLKNQGIGDFLMSTGLLLSHLGICYRKVILKYHFLLRCAVRTKKDTFLYILKVIAIFAYSFFLFGFWSVFEMYLYLASFLKEFEAAYH